MFLIPKSHPESQHPLVEWRISFSLVERRILFNIPDYQRTAYLILKDRIEKKVKEKKSIDQSYKSYHLKTVLLELTSSKHYCTGGIHNNVYEFTKSLIERLTEAYEKKYLPNFFLQKQNLLEHEDVESIKEILINESRSLDMSRGEFCEDPDELWKFKVTVLSNDTFSSYMKEQENEIIPQNIMLMMLTEMYHELVSPKEYFEENFCLRLIIKIKRIVCLIVLHQKHSATTSSTTNEDFSGIINVPIKSAAKYFEVYQSISPKDELPMSRKDLEKILSFKSQFKSQEEIDGKQIIKLIQNYLGKFCVFNAVIYF